jgi:hypothetical protein
MDTQYDAILIPLEIEHTVVNVGESGQDLAGQLVDFSMMPHYGMGEDCARPRRSPNISEDLMSKPFEATNNPLPPGVHLHWALPKDFRRAVIQEQAEGQQSTAPRYRPVPNRWLIERVVFTRYHKTGEFKRDENIHSRCWVLESDALQTTRKNGSCAFPLDPEMMPQNGGPHYRFLGKVYEWEDWVKKENDPEDSTRYLDELHAMGYGDPLFSAYYPECRNVFGFHDDLEYRIKEEHNGAASDKLARDTKKYLTKDSGKYDYELRYVITGWYSRPWQDFSRSFEYKRWITGFGATQKDDRIDKIPVSTEKVNLNGLIYGYMPEAGNTGGSQQKEALNWLIFPLEKERFGQPAKGDQMGFQGSGQFSYQGIVHDEETGTPLTDVFIIIPGTNMGTKTDIDGRFRLNTNGVPTTMLFFKDGYAVAEYHPNNSYAIIKTSLRPTETFSLRTVLMGRIGGIIWDNSPSEKTTENNDSSSQKHDLRVVLANTPGQALAALLADGTENSHRTEAMLDALQLGLFAEEEKLDFPARLEGALHSAGFQADPGERRWSITRNRDGEQPRVPEGEDVLPSVQPEWADKLKNLNLLQQDMDKQFFRLKDRQQQVYADWYKFLIAEYDFSLDEITAEAQVNSIREYLANEADGLATSIASIGNVQEKIEALALELRMLLETWNRKKTHLNIRFELDRQPGTRYWSPLDPVLLFEGADAIPVRRYQNTDELLLVGRVPGVFQGESNLEMATGMKEFIEACKLFSGKPYAESTFLGLQDGSKNSWNPIYMDWEVETFPFTKPSDKDFNQKDWPADSIVANYDLFDGNPDLRLQDVSKESNNNEHYQNWIDDTVDTQQLSGKRLQSIQGRTFLSPNAHLPLLEQLQEQLKKAGIEKSDLIEKVRGLKVLSQSLSGFNDAMIMRKRILQLKVTDPLAQTRIFQDFTQQLRNLIGLNNAIAPLPSNLFLPLREGPFQIRKVRLVDCWGKTKTYHFTQNNSDGRIIIADAMRPPANVYPRKANMAYLPPRIIQPSRLNFRWLSATDQGSEAGTHASNTPICGYLMPNFLDSSIHVFDSTGAGLCVLARSAKNLVKNPFPGNSAPKQISDLHLENFINSIINNPDREKQIDFLADFLLAARESSGVNLPENYAQFDGMALLVGRPLALVRAKLSLELRGNPAVNNSWNARETVYQNQEFFTRPSMGFDKLRFAVRLGDKFRADDGFFAYYIDKGTETVQELYSPYSKDTGSVLDKGEFSAENYWKKSAALHRWKDVYAARKAYRQKEKLECIDQLAGLKIRLNRIFSGALSALEAQILKEPPAAEMADLQTLKARLEAYQQKLEKDERIEIPVALLDTLLDKGLITGQEMEELEDLPVRFRETKDRLEALETEYEDLDSAFQSYQKKIHDLQIKHGYKHEGLGLYAPHNDLLTLSLEEDELHLGILMDPRAAVHLTTGILPVKRVDIPPDLFAQAINNIQIAFLTTPVISPEPKETLDLGDNNSQKVDQKFLLQAPLQKGYNWTWFQPGEEAVIPSEQIGTPPAGYFPIFGPQLIFDGWMKMNPDKKPDSPEGQNTENS